jgi:hypothetical protein
MAKTVEVTVLPAERNRLTSGSEYTTVTEEYRDSNVVLDA